MNEIYSVIEEKGAICRSRSNYSSKSVTGPSPREHYRKDFRGVSYFDTSGVVGFRTGSQGDINRNYIITGLPEEPNLVSLGDISDSEDEHITKEVGLALCDFTSNFTFLTMPPLWHRTHMWRMNILLLCIIALGGYIMFLDPSATEDIPKNAIDLEEIEQELENGNPVKIIKEYKSPIDDRIFQSNKLSDRYGRNFQFESDLAVAYKYHKIWQWADEVISEKELFPEVPEIDDVIRAMQTARIVNVDVLDIGYYESGTSEKWVATLEGGQKAMLKIIWDGENVGGMKDRGQCNFGFEMPWSEIAAFHLHRVLGFRNTPFVTGRWVDLHREILPAASQSVAKQITVKSGNKTCVTGKCFHCKEKVVMCPIGGKIRVSLVFWVPRKIKLWTYPPKYMPFSTPRIDEWGKLSLNDRTFCNKVKQEIEPYQDEGYFLDLMDFAVLDTLMYHYDSKHYTIADNSPAAGLTIRIDHGRSFCASDQDEEHIFLAPLHQCCKLRRSTWEAISTLRSGELSRKWRHAMEADPLAPVMREEWFTVLNRRLKIIIKTVEKCSKANGGMDNVLV